jgi:putative transposase
VLDGRYQHHSLRSPREVRRALAYALLDARRHLLKQRRKAIASSRVLIDPASSARWFDGCRLSGADRFQEAIGTPEVARPRTWLLRVGWRRHGLLDPVEVPGAAMPARAYKRPPQPFSHRDRRSRNGLHE